ncbi:hypothetical protein CLV67_120155 [Actinoplanes italicus]|uniref:Uncharacterized protein n=1 Tax=Actinoplanes italicus TaxID=113567 RepID=A0A2T0K0S7_9ACTN|nr:hypothetical protein CLV67_120155 [Actinoplanes italicus]
MRRRVSVIAADGDDAHLLRPRPDPDRRLQRGLGTTRHFTGHPYAGEGGPRRPGVGGIHFRTVDVQGKALGESVSACVTAHHFRKVRR